MGFDAEHVVPGAGGGPHLVVLQQVGVDEHAQVRGVAERRHAADGEAGGRRARCRRRPARTSMPPAAAASFFSSSWLAPLT